MNLCQIARNVAVAAAVGFTFAPAAQSAFTIDDFQFGQGVNVAQLGPGNEHFNRVVDGTLFGGDRELYIERDGSLATTPQVNDGRMDVGFGVLDLQVRNDEKARGTVTYDGVGVGDSPTPDYLGTPDQFNLDFNFAPYRAFSFIGGTDLSGMGLPVFIRVYNTDGTKWTEATVNLQYLLNDPLNPNDDEGEFTYLVAFDSFRNAFNSADDNAEIFGRLPGNSDVAGALQLAIGKTAFGQQNIGADASIQFLQVTNTPEPGTMALLGAGLIALVTVARKRAA